MTVKRDIELAQALFPFTEMAEFEGLSLTRPESTGPDGDTPLHVAAFLGRIDWLEALFPYVTNLDVPGDIGNSPLHCALVAKKRECVRFLIDHGANIDLENDYGDTPRKLMAPDSVEPLT